MACRSWRFALALFLLLSIPAVSAQQRPVFQATVAQVRVDVIVTDDDGRFVRDLSLEDFIIYEDDETFFFAWKHDGCGGYPAQRELCKFMKGSDGCYRLAYAVEETSFSPERFQQWLDIIAASELKPMQ